MQTTTQEGPDADADPHADANADAVAKNVLYTIAGNYGEYLVGLICSILIARTLSPAHYGDYAFLIWLCGLSVAIVNTGIATSLINFVAKYKAKSTAEAKAVYEFMGQLQQQKLLLALLPIWLVLWFNYEQGGWAAIGVASMLTLAVVAKAFHMFRISAFKGLERYDGIAKIAVLVGPLQLLSAGMLWYLDAPVWAFLVQYLGVTLLMNLASYWLLTRMQHEQAAPPDMLDKPAILSHARSLTPSELMAFLTTASIGLVFLRLFSTSETLAFYNIGVMVATAIVSLVPGLVDMLLLPIVSRTISSSESDLGAVFKASTRHLLQLTLFILGPIYLFGDQVIRLAYGDEYAPAAAPLYWLTIFMALAHFGRMLYTYLISSEQKALLVRIAGFSFGLMLLLNALLVPLFELQGAIAAFSLSTLAITVVTYRCVRDQLAFGFEPWLYLRSIAASLCAGLLVYQWSAHQEPSLIGIALGSLGFGLVTLLLMALFRAFGQQDVAAVRALLANR